MDTRGINNMKTRVYSNSFVSKRFCDVKPGDTVKAADYFDGDGPHNYRTLHNISSIEINQSGAIVTCEKIEYHTENGNYNKLPKKECTQGYNYIADDQKGETK